MNRRICFGGNQHVKAIKKTNRNVLERLMMNRSEIPAGKFDARIFYLWSDKWFLLTSGDYEERNYNTMTVAWGSFGIMWNKPFAQVVVRPTRHTFEFTEEYDSFTLCVFPERYREALRLLGTKSGRDGDKIAESGLTVSASQKITAPSFEEAELILECQKIYWDDFDPIQFIDQSIYDRYPEKDYHRIYFGEVVRIEGTELYHV